MTSVLRFIGIVLLACGLIAILLWFPSRPDEPWDLVHGFEIDETRCRVFRESRETALFVHGQESETSVTVAEVVRRFNLELPLVCRANSLPAGCGSQPLAPGQELLLPLDRRAHQP
jgi:hypothetical protein